MRLPPTDCKRAGKLLALAGIIALGSMAQPGSRARTALELVQIHGELQMATVGGLTTYFEDANGGDGFEYQLARAFAKSLGVKLQVRLNESLSAVYEALDRGEGNFAAAGLIANTGELKPLRYSSPYSSVEQKLICPLGTRKPRSLADLKDGDLIAVADGLRSAQLTESRKNNSRLTWTVVWGAKSVDLIEKIHQGESVYAVVDSASYAANHNFYPKTRAAFSITSPEPVGWGFPSHGDDSLLKAANRFLENYDRSGDLQRLKDRFFARGSELSLNVSQPFMADLTHLLPRYQSLFIRVASEYDIEWHLLAAIAYQESRWDPLATSPTGVRGLMMLTEETALEMGVTDRLDAEQSLRGGTKYLLELRRRIPGDVAEPDRTWLALAAYNVGLAHLEDARTLTERSGKNPNRWLDVNEHLPLLQHKKHYASIKYGFARGGETAAFVKRVRRYQSILGWHDREQELFAAKHRVNLPSSADMDDDQESL